MHKGGLSAGKPHEEACFRIEYDGRRGEVVGILFDFVERVSSGGCLAAGDETAILPEMVRILLENCPVRLVPPDNERGDMNG